MENSYDRFKLFIKEQINLIHKKSNSGLFTSSSEDFKKFFKLNQQLKPLEFTQNNLATGGF